MTKVIDTHTIWQSFPNNSDDSLAVYALLDGAADPLIYAHIEEEDNVLALPLLSRTDVPPSYSPWLVKLDKKSLFTQWMLEQGLFSFWGLMIRSELSLLDLKHHLEDYLQVFDEPTQMPALMRFYDPRIFYAFTQVLEPKKQESFFAPIDFVGSPAPFKDNTLRYYTCSDNGVTFTEQDLSADPIDEAQATLAEQSQEAPHVNTH